ncbi:MAG: hypothetical protein U5N58_01500 [Actinomycetota bacterium]|nr:hypothetical protein [Actinomycetota bacterium]
MPMATPSYFKITHGIFMFEPEQESGSIININRAILSPGIASKPSST